MKNLRMILVGLLCCCNGMVSFAQGQVETLNELLRAINGSLKLSIKNFNGTSLLSEQQFNKQLLQTKTGKWSVQFNATKVSGHSEVMDVAASFRLNSGFAKAAAVSVSFDFNKWSSENYVLVPASVYNGNRYHAIGNSYNPPYPKEMYYNPKVPWTISNGPRLAIEKGKASLIELQTTSTATPAMCFYSPSAKKGFIVFTDQQSEFGNHGLSIIENAAQDSCSFSITAPSVRKLTAGFGDYHASGDQAPDWKSGDRLTIRFRVYVFTAHSIPDLLTEFMQVRKELIGLNQPRNQLPMSKVLDMARAICSNNFITVSAGSYYTPENGDDFQLGWVSGMINTYPMLAMNDEKERNRVVTELDFVVKKLQGTSGYFYGGITAKGEIRPEEMNPAYPALQAMVRKNGDVLLWLMKHLLLFKAQGYGDMIKSEWEAAVCKLAAAFTRTWEKEGEFGQFIAPETGEVAVYNSTAGAIVPAGLAIASDYFKQPEWLEVAKASASFYYNRDVVKQGLTGGACGDISMDSDSETAFGFLESLMALYYYTGHKGWLRKAEVEAALCATWTISYDPIFPEKSQIWKLKSKMAGAIWASIQNKHAAPGICTSSADYLFKLFRATGNDLYADLLRDIQHAHAEAVNVPPHHVTTNNLVGSSMERIQPSDAEGKGSIGNFINTRNSWTETNGMLMALEIPGIYVNMDQKKLYVFDHVKGKILSNNKSGITIEIANTTRHDAEVSVMAETEKQAAKPLSYTAFLGWPKVKVKTGETILVKIDHLDGVKVL